MKANNININIEVANKDALNTTNRLLGQTKQEVRQEQQQRDLLTELICGKIINNQPEKK